MNKINKLNQADREEVERLIAVICKDDIIGQRLASAYPEGLVIAVIQIIKKEGLNAENYEEMLERIRQAGGD